MKNVKLRLSGRKQINGGAKYSRADGNILRPFALSALINPKFTYCKKLSTMNPQFNNSVNFPFTNNSLILKKFSTTNYIKYTADHNISEKMNKFCISNAKTQKIYPQKPMDFPLF